MHFLIGEMAPKHVPWSFPASVCATYCWRPRCLRSYCGGGLMEKFFKQYLGEFLTMAYFILNKMFCYGYRCGELLDQRGKRRSPSG